MEILRFVVPLLAITALIFLFFRLLKLCAGNKREQIQAVIAVLVAIIPLADTSVRDFIPKKMSEDDLDRIKPMLECTLHVEHVDTNSYTLHLELFNRGQTKARNVLVAYSSPEFKRADIFRQEQDELIPGGRIMIGPDIPSVVSRIQNGQYAIKAVVTFESEESLGPRYYWTGYTFSIPDSSLTPGGTYPPSSCHSESGHLPPHDVLSRIGFFDSMDSATGTFCVWFKTSPVTHPITIAQSKTMLVLYEPQMNSLMFSRFLENAGVSATYNLAASTNDWHFIAVTWSNFATTVFVDGNSVTLPDVTSLPQRLPTSGSSLPSPTAGSGN